jgi:hypothetical protein
MSEGRGRRRRGLMVMEDVEEKGEEEVMGPE